MFCGERQIRTGEGSEERVDLGGPLAISSHGTFQAWAGAKAHVWVHDPATAAVCIDVHGSCYQQMHEDAWLIEIGCPALLPRDIVISSPSFSLGPCQNLLIHGSCNQ